mmetsp:Transcript_14144/g.26468  ORF Transcript_14144/g.26468 Transcript_14144/m.26468 type:complete len:80 (-) Transcript_14144:734-973(-)
MPQKSLMEVRTSTDISYVSKAKDGCPGLRTLDNCKIDEQQDVPLSRAFHQCGKRFSRSNNEIRTTLPSLNTSMELTGRK